MRRRFPHDPMFDAKMAEIPDLVWYPYVGADFAKTTRRLLVLAHNVPVPEAIYDRRKAEMEQRDFWTHTLDEYTYTQGFWTESFRSFVKAAAGLTENFTSSADLPTQDKVDSFVRSIAYINFIQGLVLSSRQIARAGEAQIERSKSINAALLSILGVTHCICWGEHVFNYLTSTTGHHFENPVSCGRRGFGSGLLRICGDKPIHLLKIHHPSMPRFGRFSPETHLIIANFIRTPALHSE